MADESNDANEDSWLYGSSTNPNEEPQENEEENDVDSIDESKKQEDNNKTIDANQLEISQDSQQACKNEPMNTESVVDQDENDDENGVKTEEKNKEGDGNTESENSENDDDDEDGDDDDDDDDDINVVIGDIKSGPTYNIKQRSTALLPSGVINAIDKPKQTGKFNIEEFESVGTINGVAAHEFSIDSLDEKPWRKPGADITDYFNYGFNEDTWRAYCERQKKMRQNESGVGLQGLTINQTISVPTNPPIVGGMNMGGNLIRRAGPPPANGFKGIPQSKENVIQVMTAERREYSRVPGKFDGPMMPNQFMEPFFEPEPETYNYGYEPVQEQQWNNESGWVPTGIKELTPGPQILANPMNITPPMRMMPPQMVPPPHLIPMGPPTTQQIMPPPTNVTEHRDRDRERERDRDRDYRDRDRERDRDRDRDRDHSKSEDVDRNRDDDSPGRDRDRRRDRDRYRERSIRRDRSRSRDRSRERRRRSKSRDNKDRKSRDKKKSHKKDKDDKDSD